MIKYEERKFKEIRQLLEKKDKVIKQLVLKFHTMGRCRPDVTDKICTKFFTTNSSPNGCVACWTDWAESQIKNGT